MKRTLIAVLAIAVLAVGATVASAHRGGGKHGSKGAKERVFTLKPDPAGNPEGIAFDKRSRSFFVGITADGAIYRGTLGSDTVAPFIEGDTGKAADRPQGQARQALRRGRPDRQDHRLRPRHQGGRRDVRDRHGRLPQRPRGDPARRRLRHRLVPPDAVARDRRAGRGRLRHAAGARRQRDPLRGGRVQPQRHRRQGQRKLVVVDTNSGKLFRIKLDEKAARSGDRRDHGATVPGGDGMLLDRDRLVVVQGDPAQLSFLKLRNGARSARSSARRRARSSAGLDGRRDEGPVPRRQRRLRHQHEAVHGGGPAAQVKARRPSRPSRNHD